MTKVALVTGASSGIGRATALVLAQAGFTTYATARKLDSISDLKKQGCRVLRLDVTDEASMLEVVETIRKEQNSIDLLINNAGYGEMGAIEEVTLEAWRKQFETNVFGLIRLTQLVLPLMRAKGNGRIINIGSGGGEFTFPLGGAYHASKYALEAISDALRFEVKPFGVTVVLIQPSPVKTPLAENTIDSIQAIPNSPYEPMINSFRKMSEQSYQSGRGYLPVETVVRVILKAATANKPKPRYKVGMIARSMSFLRHLLSDRAWDGILAQMYKPVKSS